MSYRIAASFVLETRNSRIQYKTDARLTRLTRRMNYSLRFKFLSKEIEANAREKNCVIRSRDSKGSKADERSPRTKEAILSLCPISQVLCEIPTYFYFYSFPAFLPSFSPLNFKG